MNPPNKNATVYPQKKLPKCLAQMVSYKTGADPFVGVRTPAVVIPFSSLAAAKRAKKFWALSRDRQVKILAKASFEKAWPGEVFGSGRTQYRTLAAMEIATEVLNLITGA